MTHQLIAFVLAMLLSATCVAIHFEGLNLLSRLAMRRVGDHRMFLVVVICGLIVTHVLESVLFALGFWLGEANLNLGRFVGDHALTPIFYFYFSLETYTTQALGDIYPIGSLRMIASIEPLTGLILIGWSTSFTFPLMGRYWRDRLQ